MRLKFEQNYGNCMRFRDGLYFFRHVLFQNFNMHSLCRFHDSIESLTGEEFLNEVRLNDRPRHCDSTEVIAHSLRARYAGFSVSNLQRWFHFSAATPRLSPPTICLSPPSTGLASTLKYLQPYLHERKLQDPIPDSWLTTSEGPDDAELVRVRKESLHICDGDSCEITLSESDDGGELENFVTHRGKTIRIRMLGCDSPEVANAVRIYKQPEDSTAMTTFLTRHTGIECLRAARTMVFDARGVFLQVERDFLGKPVVRKDDNGRLLANMYIETSEGSKVNFVEKLASCGFTLSFYTTGIDRKINSAMKTAIHEKRGVFNLPDEAFTYPFRPWDIRKRTTLGELAVYDEYREILNQPADPAVAWSPTETSAPLDAGDDDESAILPDSEISDSFYLRIVPSKLIWESRCLVAPSTIPDAGRGLFVQPHDDTINVDDHLCIYAERSTTQEEATRRGSSRVYLIQSAKSNKWFDADIETGNNIGRFANQPGVMQALCAIKEMSAKDKPQITDDDWRRIEHDLDELCNARFHVVADQMVLKAKKPFHKTFARTEVFVNYGGLRQYWIPLIIEHQADNLLPRRMVEIVTWLKDDRDCNWTAEQRRDWLS